MTAQPFAKSVHFRGSISASTMGTSIKLYRHAHALVWIIVLLCAFDIWLGPVQSYSCAHIPVRKPPRFGKRNMILYRIQSATAANDCLKWCNDLFDEHTDSPCFNPMAQDIGGDSLMEHDSSMRLQRMGKRGGEQASGFAAKNGFYCVWKPIPPPLFNNIRLFNSPVVDKQHENDS